MKRTDFDILAEEVLTQIEMKENQLLEWGFIGGSIDAGEEVRTLLRQPPTSYIEELVETLGLTESDAMSVVNNLVDRKLLFQLNAKHLYRSRYADTIRLLYLLKQRFKHEDWQTGKNLVSNIKPMLTYRKYPRRNIPINIINEKLDSVIGISNIHRKVIETLLKGGELLLSKFQMDSLTRILTQSRSKFDSGTVIGAGTGSGKTKSFYIPAFATLIEAISKDQSNWTKVIGLYPRVELLKDQYREALSEILNLNPLCKDLGIRPLTIGGLYGDTPKEASDVRTHKDRQWKKTKDGYESPFFSCPKCSHPMIWREEDVEKNVERLHCSNCDTRIDEENIILTRNRMNKKAPDILFTTTEMINRKLPNSFENDLFGVYSSRPPLFILLDEVHVYEGVTGAHVAFLLRRLKYLLKQFNSNRGIQFVGLSATLSNPAAFFSQLVGLEERYIEYISPHEKDLVSEGMEYNLVVRGDPFSAAALLSTSVQTAMLLGRMLDPINKDISRGAYGSKLFGFTDKLDVINRWFHIELDAERENNLSKFRDGEEIINLIKQNKISNTFNERAKTGQIWVTPKKIEEDALRLPMQVDITSSQHKGVNENAKLIIATSTLEVGYNDPKVGAVIQHKAPRNLASFLQRKGRAGRVRGMRPWMIVISSAYGRDRFVYDYPELYFQPNLNEMYLPIHNSNVIRIQMAFAFMEWIMDRLYKQSKRLDVRDKLSAKGNTRNRNYSDIILSNIRDVLEGHDQDLIDYWKKSLQIDEDTIKRIAWSEPRSFFFDVLPTVYAQLKEKFSFISEDEFSNDPLVGYIPRTLFSSLDISELALNIPRDEKVSYQPLVQGMIEFAPGNVSKRYVNAYRIKEAHWLPVNEENVVDVRSNTMNSRFIETVKESIDVYEPVSVSLETVPRDISDRSTGRFIWDLDIQPIQHTSHNKIDFPVQNALKPLFVQIEYFTSDEHNSIKLTRFATHGEGIKKTSKGEEFPYKYKFVHNGEDCSIGFQRYVDGIRFDLHNTNTRHLVGSSLGLKIFSVSKPDFFDYLLKNDSNITDKVNVFKRQWLVQIVLSAVTAICISKDVTLQEAIEEYKRDLVRISIRTLEAIFHTTIVTDEDNSSTTDDTKVKKELQGLIEDTSFMNRILKHLETLEGNLEDNIHFHQWMKLTIIDSVAATIKAALEEMLPDINTDDTNVDIIENSIWISETESGGLGIITKIISSLKHTPSLFEELILSNINYCPRNTIASSLKLVLKHIENEQLSFVIDKIREEQRIELQQEYLKKLQFILDRLGIPPKRELIVGMAGKFFRTNRSKQTDLFMKEIHEFWEIEQDRLQFQITPNVFSVASLRRDEISDKLKDLMQSVNMQLNADKQKFLFLESFLLHDCHDSCPECLNLYSPYQSFSKPSRLLLRALIKSTHEVQHFPSENFFENSIKVLESEKRLRVVVSTAEKSVLQNELFRLFHTPIEFKFQLYYPFLERVTNNGESWYYDVSVREVSYV
jgi:hypothetical protein